MDYSKDDNLKQKKKRASKTKKISNKFAVIISRILIAAILIGGFSAAGVAIGAYYGIIENAPDVVSAIDSIRPSNYSTILVASNGEETENLFIERRIHADLSQIPENLKNAFIAIEDERFYEHNGIDIRGIIRSIYTNLTTNDVQGASTITQQLIKNNVTDVLRNTIDTKLQEQYLAVKLENLLSSKEHLGSKQAAKDYILELYLNTIGLHHGLYGVQTASLYYFNKDVSELTLSESAVIAAITQNPGRYTPKNRPEENEIRRNTVLRKMLELGMISQQQLNEALADNVYERIREVSALAEEESSQFSYFTDQVINEVTKALQDEYGYSKLIAERMIFNSGWRIETTQDLAMQEILDKEFLDNGNFPENDFEILIRLDVRVRNTITDQIKDHYRTWSVKSQEEVDGSVDVRLSELVGANDEILGEPRVILTLQPQAAMIILDQYTGKVRAMSGGRGEKMLDRSLNRATDSTRQPGSVFKVLAAFAPAIDLGKATAGTIIMDEPFTVGSYSPRNWYSNFRGPSTIRQGIKDSMNIVAVRSMVEYGGIDASFDYLLNFGFTTLVDGELIGGAILTDRGPATALGGLTKGVTQLEVTAAYASIANKGEYIEPVFFEKVYDREGNLILESKSNTNQVLKETTAFIITDMMKDVVSGGGTGGAANFRNLNMPIAGKTGTTTDSLDLTFVGYTPYYTAGIWVGYDTPESLSDSRYHLQLWSKIMEQIHVEKGLTSKPFEMPSGLTNVTVCSDSGMIASESCRHDHRGNRAITDYFVTGTLPTASCNLHVPAQICTESGLLATQFCPEHSIASVTRFSTSSDESQDAYCNIHTEFQFPTMDDDMHFYLDPIDGSIRTYPPTSEFPSIFDDSNISDIPSLPGIPDLGNTQTPQPSVQITPAPSDIPNLQVTQTPAPSDTPNLQVTQTPAPSETSDLPSEIIPTPEPAQNILPIMNEESLDDFDY